MCGHAPEMLSGLIDFGLAALRELDLGARNRELVALAVADATDCPYQRIQHLPLARAAGLTEAEIAAPDTVPRPAAADTVLLAATRELLTEATVLPGTMTALQVFFSDREIVEAILLVGYFRKLAGILNAVEIELDPQGELLVVAGVR
ncbi:carboxymuconolactone decarboxylase family protein [Crossiella cryophila]|uniref:AhpD family alkylhydroperoxidase n=1 Tax=Crossiella cryophila TaxID=43355 RepID=A0A7W7CEG0_9PSEU|nr:carboxymuconolactone decarboxylase family protein [Crossiella cryophila]MBB4679605.1 AhpD family alkylhydroperoxidase [Crossiella cryophila]